MDELTETTYFDIDLESEPRRICSHSKYMSPKEPNYPASFAGVISESPMIHRITSGDLKHLDYVRKCRLINKYNKG